MDGDFRGPAARPSGERVRPGTTRIDGLREAPRADRAPANGRGATGALHGAAPKHDVRQLMRGGTQAVLTLDGMAYSLRITRAGKLILTK